MGWGRAVANAPIRQTCERLPKPAADIASLARAGTLRIAGRELSPPSTLPTGAQSNHLVRYPAAYRRYYSPCELCIR